MAFVNVLSGLGESLASAGKSTIKNKFNPPKKEANTKEAVTKSSEQIFAAQKSFFQYQTSINIALLKSNKQLFEKVDLIVSRISPTNLTVGKGKNKQTYRYDPLAPQGSQITALTASGKAGRFASKKEQAAVLSKAAYLGSPQAMAAPRANAPTPLQKISDEERFKQLERISFEESETPLAMFKEETNKNFKKVFEMLEDLKRMIENVDDGGGLGGIGFGRRGAGGRRGRRSASAAAQQRYRRRFGDRAANRRFGGGGRFGGIGVGGAVAGGLGAVAGGALAYSAVNSMRDENLVSEDPEALKQQAIAARESGDKQQTEAVRTQIQAQKRDVKIQAAATGAGAVGAVGGGIASVKLWKLFVNYVKKKAPKLAAKLGARLAAAGAMAAVPVVGWIGTAITLGFTAWMAYDLYQLWKEFSALSDAEKETYTDEIQKLEANKDKPGAKPRGVDEPPAGMGTPQATMGTGAPAAAPAAPTTTPEAANPVGELPVEPGSMTVTPTETAPAGLQTNLSDIDLKQVAKIQPGVDVDGLQDNMYARLAGMAQEYYAKTGKRMQINSGYRDSRKQAELYAKIGPPNAAPPGRSLHERGLAVDMNSADANEAIKLGLFDKYGFKRPIAKETWHVEPVETRGGPAFADNPLNPGAPVAVASASGAPVTPEGDRVNTEVAAAGGSVTPVATSSAPAAVASTPTPAGAPPAPTPVAAAPVAAMAGAQMAAGSVAVDSSRAQMAATPTVINNVVQAPAQQMASAPPPPPRPLPEADIEKVDYSIKASFNRDRWALG